MGSSVTSLASENEYVAGPVTTPRPAQHLCADEVLGQQQPDRGRVVVRDQGLDARDHVREGHAVDRRHPLADVLAARGVLDDVDAVCEVVHSEREEVEGPCVRRVVEEDAAVPVTLAQRRQAQQADDELVPRGSRRALGEAGRLRAQLGQRYLVVDVGVQPRHLIDEAGDLALQRRRCGGVACGRRGTAGEREGERRHEDPPHRSANTPSAHSIDPRVDRSPNSSR